MHKVQRYVSNSFQNAGRSSRGKNVIVVQIQEEIHEKDS